jgi:SRSO17 transposase
LGEGERKSVEPIAARACGSPEEADAMHRKLLRFVGESPWEDRPLRKYAARYAIEQMEVRGPIRHWIVDDTGFIKQGRFSPGVQRQYTGSAGKTTNCQVAVSLTLATDHAHLPVDMQLYLPESWAADRKRCRAAGIPDEIHYRPKWEISLEMMDAAVAAGLPQGIVLADTDYGNKNGFRDRLDAMQLRYAVAVKKNTCVRRVVGIGKRHSVGKRMSVEELAFELDPKDIRKVTWREGTNATMSARFAIVRVEPAPTKGPPRQEQWLIIEWPDDSHLPTKYNLATLPRRWSRKQLVRVLKERWRTERAYQDLKGELGLDHFEGRSYRGWNHHVTVVLACNAFLAAEQARAFPPSAVGVDESPPDHALHRAA